MDTVVISTQHDPDVSLEQIRKDMIEQVAKAVIPADMLDENTKYYVNPTGKGKSTSWSIESDCPKTIQEEEKYDSLI